MQDPESLPDYTLLGNAAGWLIAIFLGKKALADRDERINKIEEWKEDHEKNHPNIVEILRMHQELREDSQRILGLIERNHQDHQEDFRHLQDRLDNVIEQRSHPREKQ